MKVLVTGHQGYVGCVLVPMLLAHGHEVVGLDSGLFEGCEFDVPPVECETIRKDIRDVETGDLEGFDAICHLAGISNDPLGDLNPGCTYEINHRATVTLARAARTAGVVRFLQASSCSVYGAAGTGLTDESGAMRPVTPYGRSKMLVEHDLSEMAGPDFSPIFLRNATAYGVSPRLRCDLVVNNLVGYAVTTGKVLIKSDGMAWRPLVHVEDISLAFLAALHADRELVHNRVLNVGDSAENYRVRDIAVMIEELVPGSRVEFAMAAAADNRCYRVACERIRETLPEFRPAWTLRRGIAELRDAYVSRNLTLEEFESARYLRIGHVLDLQGRGLLDGDLRWLSPRTPLRRSVHSPLSALEV